VLTRGSGEAYRLFREACYAQFNRRKIKIKRLSRFNKRSGSIGGDG
jgi:hypothetical protein